MRNIKILFLLASVAFNARVYSQAGAKWSTSGNNLSTGEFIGSANNFPLNFRINNTQRMSLSTTGVLNLNILQGTNTRFLQTDANGNIIPFPNGNSNEVLFGNGVWGNLPLSATIWSLTGNHIINQNSGNVGIGISNPLYKLDVFGDVRISNNLFVGGGIIITDEVNASNEVNTGIVTADSITFSNGGGRIVGNTNFGGDIVGSNKLTVSGNVTFNSGMKLTNLAGTEGSLLVDQLGNIIKGPKIPLISCIPGSPQWSIGGDVFAPYSTTLGVFNEASVGTCNNYPFILKSNAINRAWFQTDGSVTFGTNVSSNTFGPEYRFKSGVIRLQSNNTYGGPQIIFDMDNSTTPYGDWGLEYTQALPQPSKNGLNFWKPFGSTYSNNGILFLADDGTIGMGTYFPTTRLTLDAWNGDGLKAITDNSNSKAISLNLKNSSQQLQEYFSIMGNGYTQLNIYNVGTMPAPGGSPRAFTIRDVANSKDLFVVNANGKTYAREVEISLISTFPDYVFEKSYNLKSIEEVEEYIVNNKHLPGFENAQYYEKNGINVNEMFIKQQEKIEELTLYIIELKKELKALKNQK